ncbi:hypothetical protein Tcan_02464 [Toxocara canis]|uniref:Uncharacterized protein n=1 Tax=Toxocara canis TaxID=6265 RepID=A0A0B2UP36_TOXCA|nr:hypothetical protein Tcan_02464 [Toxocara canis]
MEEWTLNGGEVRFALTQYVRRQISFVPVQEADLLTSDGMIRRRRDTLRDIPCEEMDYTEGDQLDGVVTQWAELDFRTTANYGTVFAIVEESKSSHMKVRRLHSLCLVCNKFSVVEALRSFSFLSCSVSYKCFLRKFFCCAIVA